MKYSVMLAAVVLAGCSYNVDTAKTYESVGVARLYDYPSGEYERLGLHAWGLYQAGFSEPSVAKVWDDVSDRVRALGGNACIVRHDQVVSIWGRTIEVTCEVLVVR